MKTTISALLFTGFISLPFHISANDNSDIEKNNSNSVYDLLNDLNQTLKSELNIQNKTGIEQVSTFKKNNQIIIQVTHDPQHCYSNMINNISETSSRVNGINFQNSFTLDIVDSYCKTDLFYTIHGEGLDKEVIVQYEDLRGNSIAQHRINKQLCHL